MAGRLSALRFAFRMRRLPHRTGAARVVTVWDGYPPDARRLC
jgi:hypothetical protein